MQKRFLLITREDNRVNKTSVNTVFSILPGNWLVLLPALALLFIQLLPASPALAEAAKKPLKFSVLIYGDNRLDTLEGFRHEMAKHEEQGGYIVSYDIKNAQNDRDKLAGMAREIIQSQPDIAIAGGGIEADALKAASAGTSVPVVFLAVSAAVDRGLVRDLRQPGGNLTGIETNDAELTGKRLWYITKILPQAKKITIFHVPDIGASVQSLKVARETADTLGLELTVLEGKSREDIIKAAATITAENTDVLLITPVAPVESIMKEYLLPLSLEKKNPGDGQQRGNGQKRRLCFLCRLPL